MQKAMTVPILQVLTALSHLPAPIFCAHMVEMEAPIATAGSTAKLLNYATTPTAADAFTPPITLTKVVIIIKEILVIPF